MNLSVKDWFFIGLLVAYFLYLYANRVPREYYQNYADAYLWPFDRILLPIHYWLAQFYPNNYSSWFLHPYYHPTPQVPAGPWYQLTH